MRAQAELPAEIHAWVVQDSKKVIGVVYSQQRSLKNWVVDQSSGDSRLGHHRKSLLILSGDNAWISYYAL